VTDTVATGGVATVRTDVPDLPSLVAMMVVIPGVIAVMRPLGETVATEEEEELQRRGRPVRSFPLASRRIAVA
jgi:hypothetical protein